MHFRNTFVLPVCWQSARGSEGNGCRAVDTAVNTMKINLDRFWLARELPGMDFLLFLFSVTNSFYHRLYITAICYMPLH